MAMTPIDDYWKKLAEGIGGLAVGTLKEYKDQVQKDGKAFTDKIKSDVELWSKQLSEGKIDIEDFEFLVKGKKDLAELLALKQTAIAKVAMDKFVTDLIDLITGTFAKYYSK
jgi:hypothetical protein